MVIQKKTQRKFAVFFYLMQYSGRKFVVIQKKAQRVFAVFLHLMQCSGRNFVVTQRKAQRNTKFAAPLFDTV